MLDPFTIKPLDKKLILDSARATKGRILTVEDHYYEGEELGAHSWTSSPRRAAAARETRAAGTWFLIRPQAGVVDQ